MVSIRDEEKTKSRSDRVYVYVALLMIPSV